MRAVVCEQLGPVEALTVRDEPDPEPRDGQVLIRVEAAGVNYVDALLVQGRYQITVPPPFVPGTEAAGTVEHVGAGVTAFASGDRVAGFLDGAFAELTAAAADQLVAVPTGVTNTVAAAFTQSYGTAMFALRERAGLQPGQTVLVLGASGGVGRACVDVATALGARVIAAASSAQRLEHAVAAGAESTIEYTTEDLKTRARELSDGGVDVVVDPVGGAFTEPALRSLGDDGRLLVVGFAAGDIPRLPANQILLRNRRVIGVEWGSWIFAHPHEHQAMLEELLAMVADGALHPAEPTPYPLEGAADALADLLGRRLVGKAVVVP